MIQNILTIIIVTLAVAFTIYSAIKKIKSANKNDCCSCCDASRCKSSHNCVIKQNQSLRQW